MIYILLLILLVVIYKAFDYSIYMEGNIKITLIYILFAFVYYLGIPIEMLIKGTSVGAYGILITERVRLIIISMGILSIAGFTTGYFLSGFSFKRTESSISFTDTLLISVIALVTVSGILLFAVFYDSILNSISSYTGNYTETYTNSVYAYLKEIFTYGLAVLISFLCFGSRLRKILALIPSVILVIFGLISRDKDPILLSILGWGVLFFYRLTQLQLHNMKIYFIVLVTGLILIPAFSLLFTMYRSDALKETFKQLKLNGLYTYFDASGPLESMVEIIEDPKNDFEFGKTYYWGFISWIPKSVWPERPKDLAILYAQEKIQDWQPGKGMGYSLMTEAYKNFGVPGALLQYFFIGLLLGLLGKLFLWLFNNKTESLYVFFIWLSYNLAIMHRGPFNLPSSFIRFLLPFLLCYYGIEIMVRLYNFWKSRKA